jgi:hypothetical protein
MSSYALPTADFRRNAFCAVGEVADGDHGSIVRSLFDSMPMKIRCFSAHGAFLAPVLLVCLCGASMVHSQDVVEKWNVRYDGTTDGVHQGRAVAVDVDGNVVATGPSVSGSGFDFYTIKYRAADGVRIWDDRYDGTGDADDVPVAVVIDGAGHVIVGGSSVGSSSGLDVFLRKYNGATGATLWSERYNGPSNGEDAATALALDAVGDVVVTGRSAATGDGLDFYTAKYAAANGARLWFRRYNGPGDGDDVASDVAVDAGGAVIVTGTSRGGNGSNDVYTAKYAGATNDLIWDERYDGPGGGDDSAVAVAVDGAGNALVAGTVSNNGNPDIYVAKLAAADGDELWSVRDNGTGNGGDSAAALAVDAAGDVIVVGASANGRNQDLVITKYAGANGARLWSDRYNGTGDGDDGASAVAVDPQGNVIVTGTSEGSNGTQDFYTACYDGRTGKRLWFERFDGPRNRDEQAFPNGLALGPLNSVALAGATQMTDPPSAEFDFITLLYTADLTDTDADGLPDAWENNYWGTTVGHGPADDDEADGVVALLEYAFGMDPTVGDSQRVPAPVLVDGFLSITLAKRPGVTFLVETSGTLASGSWGTASTVVVTNTAGTLTVRDTVPVSAGEPRFLRVRVTAP